MMIKEQQGKNIELLTQTPAQRRVPFWFGQEGCWLNRDHWAWENGVAVSKGMLLFTVLLIVRILIIGDFHTMI